VDTHRLVGLGALRLALDHVPDQERLAAQRASETDEVGRTLLQRLLHRLLGAEPARDANRRRLDDRLERLGKFDEERLALLRRFLLVVEREALVRACG
jgi:hypothetical protein